MKVTVFVIFAILVENSVSIPLLKRSQRSPQFVQNYAPGSQSQNFNCQYGGCGNIGGMQQIHGSHVSNHGSQFRYVCLLKSSRFGFGFFGNMARFIFLWSHIISVSNNSNSFEFSPNNFLKNSHCSLIIQDSIISYSFTLTLKKLAVLHICFLKKYLVILNSSQIM